MISVHFANTWSQPVPLIVAMIERVAVRARGLPSRTSLRRKPSYVWRPQQLVRRVTGTVRLDPSTGLADVGLPWGGTIACWPHEAIGSGLARTGVHELAASEILARLGAALRETRHSLCADVPGVAQRAPGSHAEMNRLLSGTISWLPCRRPNSS